MRVLREIDLLAVDRQIAEIDFDSLAKPRDLDQAKPVEFGRCLANRLIEPEHIRSCVIELQSDSPVALAGVRTFPPAMLIVPMEVFDEALVANLYQSLMQVTPRESRFFLFSRSKRCSSPCSS